MTLAQLTRHRHASFSVQSQRYAGIKDCSVIIPESVSTSPFAEASMECVAQCLATYKHMVDNGVPEEDARYILP